MGARTSQVDHCRSCRRIVALSSIIASSGERRCLEICMSCIQMSSAGDSRHGPGRAEPPGSQLISHNVCSVESMIMIHEASWMSPVSIHAISTTYSTSLVPPSANPAEIMLPLPSDLRSLRVHKLACASICLYGPGRKEPE